MVVEHASTPVRFAVFVFALLAGLLTGSAGRDAASAEPQFAELLAPSFELPAVWTGDLDGMVERRAIRVLTSFSKTSYFLDGLTQRGTAYEMLRAFEAFVNDELDMPSTLPVRVQIIPVPRDQLMPALAAGHADLATANLTITPERLAVVDFSDPFLENVREVVVTGPSAVSLEHLDDLAGQELHLRRSSSYWASVEALNTDLEARELPPVELVAVDPHLEDEDLLEMVGAGALPWLVVDEHKARLWVEIIPGLTLRDDLVLREGGQIAVAVRKGTPELRALVNRFTETARQGTEFGNVVMRRYYSDNEWIRNPVATEDFARLRATAELFRRYGDDYGFDWLMLAAQGYQESRIDQSVVSPAGAIGVMQILPDTAADPNVGIPDIEKVENNIHAGARYLRYLIDRYLDDPAIDDLNRTLLAFAAYNAGPTNLRRFRAEAEDMGLDPNVWFGNTEMAAAKLIGRETTAYVANIAKYYYTYRLIQETLIGKAAARAGG